MVYVRVRVKDLGNPLSFQWLGVRVQVRIRAGDGAGARG